MKARGKSKVQSPMSKVPKSIIHLSFDIYHLLFGLDALRATLVLTDRLHWVVLIICQLSLDIYHLRFSDTWKRNASLRRSEMFIVACLPIVPRSRGVQCLVGSRTQNMFRS